MEKPAIHHLVVLQVKVIYCIAAAVGLSVIALLDFYTEKYNFALVAGTFASLLLLYAAYLLVHKKKQVSPFAEWGMTLCLGAFTIVGIQIDSFVAHWVYFFPIYVYFLFPFRMANYITVIYSVAIVFVVFDAFDSHIRLQLLFSYSACYAFSMIYAFINERSNMSLYSMINTDPSTHVYNEHQLHNNLRKEITRADRQRIPLMLVAIRPPAEWRNLKAENYEYHMAAAGRQIQQCMRVYDTCYRLKIDSFIIILPSSHASDAADVINNIQEKIHSHALLDQGDFKMAYVDYQPEDNNDSVIERVLAELDKDAQQNNDMDNENESNGEIV